MWPLSAAATKSYNALPSLSPAHVSGSEDKHPIFHAIVLLVCWESLRTQSSFLSISLSLSLFEPRSHADQGPIFPHCCPSIEEAHARMAFGRWMKVWLNFDFVQLNKQSPECNSCNKITGYCVDQKDQTLSDGYVISKGLDGSDPLGVGFHDQIFWMAFSWLLFLSLANVNVIHFALTQCFYFKKVKKNH